MNDVREPSNKRDTIALFTEGLTAPATILVTISHNAVKIFGHNFSLRGALTFFLILRFLYQTKT
jgi:hypothetical protein